MYALHLCACECVPDILFVIHAPLHKAAFCIFVSCLRCFEDKEGIFYLLYYLFLIYDVCLLGGMVENACFEICFLFHIKMYVFAQVSYEIWCVF